MTKGFFESKHKAHFFVPAVLGVSLIVASSLAYYLAYSYLPKKEKAEAEAKKILKLNGNVITKVTLKSAFGLIEFECADTKPELCKNGEIATWKLISPTTAKADSSAISQVIEELEAITPDETITFNDTELANIESKIETEYGIKKERFKIEVSLKNGNLRTLLIGDVHPFEAQYYAKLQAPVDGSKESKPTVYLVSKNKITSLEKTATQLRDKRVSLSVANDITRLSLSKGATAKHLDWSLDQGKWVIAQRPSEAVKSGEVMALISKLTQLEALDVVAEDQNKPEAKKKFLSLPVRFNYRLESRDGSFEMQTYRSDGKKFYVTTSRLPGVFEVKSDDFKELDRTDSKAIEKFFEPKTDKTAGKTEKKPTK